VKERSFDIRHRLTKGGKLCVEGFETRVWTIKDPERGLKSALIPAELAARFRGE
jgi:4-hydroxybenzoyl-CoA thioesterase